jgi:hypothetical protein
MALVAISLIPTAQAQQATAAKTCVNQYADAPDVTAVKLIRSGYEIKAGWPGGLWLQKNAETCFCNTGRQQDGEMLCWTLHDPVKGGPCQ